MSRTNHTTPAFPRVLRGPRGGRFVAPTPCSECVAFAVCRPGACSAPFGCDSWVDFDGRRVDLEAECAPRQDMTEAELGAVLGTLEPGPAVELTPEEAADLMDVPEGMTPEEFAALTPAEQETARGIDGLTRLPDPALEALEFDEFELPNKAEPGEDPTPCEECGGLPSECRPCGCPHAEPRPDDDDPGPLFQR